MNRTHHAAAVLSGSLMLVIAGGLPGPRVATVAAQQQGPIDFRTDVQPLFQAHCISCHGPAQQLGGMRLDRRSSAIKPGRNRIQPGSSTYSRVYRQMVDDQYGPVMPPTGKLAAHQIKIIEAWIDQGAAWPDDVSGDAPTPAIDRDAAVLMDLLRIGNVSSVLSRLQDTPDAANTRGDGGSTPLMYAAFYGSVEAVHHLLKAGADPNVQNLAGATALMWGVGHPQVVRLLLDGGANPKARAEDGQTALSLAAGRVGSNAVVTLLLDRGATPAANALVAAAGAPDEASFRTLLERGGPPAAPIAARVLSAALRANCLACAERVIDLVDRAGLNRALVTLAPFGNQIHLAPLLERGADVNARLRNTRLDVQGRTPLMLAASSDFVPLATVKLLIARGAEVNATGPAGESSLDLARRNGITPLVNYLVDAGAKPGAGFPKAAATVPAPTANTLAAVRRSVPLLQRTAGTFVQKTGCISCHHNTLTSMTIATLRAKRVGVDESSAAAHLKTLTSLLRSQRDSIVVTNGFVTNTASNILSGLDAERYPADATTDVLASYLQARQQSDGRWRNALADHRPPIQGSDVEITATAVRALRSYAPVPHPGRYQQAIQSARDWLADVHPRSTDERAMQLLGLHWSGSARRDMLVAAGKGLLAEQRTDGGWGQLSSLGSDAYGTGQALVALAESGVLNTRHPAYQRGIRFLRNTQRRDGSWHVTSRALPFQPYFESGFPYGPDQWVSMAATNWATMALALALP